MDTSAPDLVSNDWSSSDALVLEGLTGLDEMMVNPVASASMTSGNGEAATAVASSTSFADLSRDAVDSSKPDNFDFSPDPAPAIPRDGRFQTARELRAAQERFAAQRRSAARAREGSTQRISHTPHQPGPVSKPMPAPTALKPLQQQETALPERPPSEQSLVKAQSLVRRPVHEESTPTAPAPLKPSKPKKTGTSRGRKSSRRTVRLERSPLAETLKNEDVLETTLPVTTTKSKRPSRSTLPKRSTSRPVESEPVSKPVDREIVRDVKRGSNVPPVLMAIALTSLIWGALVSAWWYAQGEGWLDNKIAKEAQSREVVLSKAIAEETGFVQRAVNHTQEDLALLAGRFESLVRLTDLQAKLFSSNSRVHFDELLDLGAKMNMGGEETREASLFRHTKERIEQAYLRKLGELPAISVKKHFSGVKVSQDTRLKAMDLLMLLNKRDEATANERARAAFVLRKFKDNDDVITQLMRTVRDDEDLQVVFAAWSSIIAVTGYEPKGGFDPADFAEWWSEKQV